MSKDTIATLSFVGAMIAVGLALAEQIPMKHGLLIGAGLGAIGFAVRPSQVTA